MNSLLQLDLGNWMLVFVRASAFLTILPIFSTPNIPVRVRVALAALLAFLVSPGLPAYSVKNADFTSLLLVFFVEASAGLAIAFVTRMVFYMVDLAGHIVASEMGLNMGSLFNPFSASQSQPPGAVLFYLATFMMVSLDMHHWLLLGFAKSYTVLPIGGVHLHAVLLEDIVKHTSRVFVVAVQISAPLIALSFITMLVFSILGRTVQQMNVFSESFAVRALGGMAVFGMTLQLSAQHILNGLRRLPEDMIRVAQFLGPG